MAYADLTGLTARIGEETLIELSDRASPPLGMVDATVIDAALADADGRAPNRTPAAFVLPLGIIAQPAHTAASIYSQAITESYGIVRAIPESW